MGLVIKKAKRDTVSSFAFGLGVINILLILLLGPLKLFISSKQNEKIQFSLYPGVIIGALLIYFSIKLQNENSWYSKTYERLGPGTLLLILLACVWFVLPAIAFLITTIEKGM